MLFLYIVKLSNEISKQSYFSDFARKFIKEISKNGLKTDFLSFRFDQRWHIRAFEDIEVLY